MIPLIVLVVVFAVFRLAGPIRQLRNVPQGLKPQCLCGLCGTTKVVPWLHSLGNGGMWVTLTGIAEVPTEFQSPIVC